MATESLFNESYEDLLKQVRVNTARDSQTVRLIEMTVSEVRVGFYKQLGATRVNYINTLDLVENPTSEDEILRKDAANIEVLWVTFLLMERLPSQTIEGGQSSVNESWNDEPVTRDADGELIKALKAQVDVGLGDLVEDPEDYQSSTIRSSSVGPDEDYIIGDNYPGCPRTGSGWIK